MVKLKSKKKHFKKNSKLLSRKNKYYQKGSGKGEEFLGKLFNKDNDNGIQSLEDATNKISLFEDRFSFFEETKPVKDLDYKTLYHIFNKISKKISITGSVAKAGEIEDVNEFTVAQDKATIDTEFPKYIDKLLQDEQQLNDKLVRDDYNKTAIYLYSSHGGHFDKKIIEIPPNTYICFLNPLDYLGINLSYNAITDGDFTKEFDKLNVELYKKIFKYRANLSDNSSGVTNEINLSNFQTKIYALECFENSTWYYPGQSCHNISFDYLPEDIDKRKTYYNIIRRFTRFQYEKFGEGKENIIQSINYEEHKKFYDMYIRNIGDPQKKSNYKTDLKNILEKRIYDNEDYRIIIFPACRGLYEHSEYANNKFLMYESFIHFINLRLKTSSDEEDNANKKKCLLNCYSENYNIAKLKLELYQKFDSIYNRNPNHSRLTPFLINIYRKLINEFRVNKDKKIFEEIPDMLSENEYKYIMQAGINKFLLLNIKLLNFCKSVKPLNYLPYEKFIFNFVYFNLDFIDDLLMVVCNSSINLLDNLDTISKYGYSASGDKKQLILDYIDFYTLLYCIIDKIGKKTFNKDTKDILININIFKEKLFQPKVYTLNKFLTIKGEEELTEKHFISRNNELTDYNKLINEKNFSYVRNYLLRDCMKKLCFSETVFPESGIEIIGDIYVDLETINFIDCNFSKCDLNNFLFDNKLYNLTEIELIHTEVRKELILDSIGNQNIKLKLLNINLEKLEIKNMSIKKLEIKFCKNLKEIIIDNTQIYEFYCEYCENLESIKINKNQYYCKFMLKGCKVDNINLLSGTYEFILMRVTIKGSFDFFTDYNSKNTIKNVRGVDISNSIFNNNINFFNVFKKDLQLLSKFNMKNCEYKKAFTNTELLNDIKNRGENCEYFTYTPWPIVIKNVKNFHLNESNKDTITKLKFIVFEDFDLMSFIQ